MRDPIQQERSLDPHGVEKGLLKERATYPGNLMCQLLPSLSRASMTAAQFERRIGELRCLEAVRAYAAAHDGNAPPDLQNLPESPTPIDLITGKAFGYEAREGGFVLDYFAAG